MDVGTLSAAAGHARRRQHAAVAAPKPSGEDTPVLEDLSAEAPDDATLVVEDAGTQQQTGLGGADSIGLSNEELVSTYQSTHDVTSLDQLLQGNEGLIHHVLKRFSHTSEPYEDLFQVARIGLIKAAQRFDLDKSCSFATYAIAIADGEVRHHLRDGLLLRQPRWARALYQRILDTQSEFFHTHHRSPSIKEISEAVNLQEEGVLEVIRAYGALDLHSLDEPFNDPRDAPSLDRTLMRAVRQEAFTLPIEDRITLYEALGVLSDMQKKILYLLFFRDLTQQEVANEMGMTQRTVSRERTKALTRLKAILNKKIL
jgi:RNA polymerase sigma-B factor